jgi:hypothetical protein
MGEEDEGVDEDEDEENQHNYTPRAAAVVESGRGTGGSSGRSTTRSRQQQEPRRSRKIVDRKFDALLREITMQRLLLVQSDDLKGFDTAWGMDPTGHFSTEIRWGRVRVDGWLYNMYIYKGPLLPP